MKVIAKTAALSIVCFYEEAHVLIILIISFAEYRQPT